MISLLFFLMMTAPQLGVLQGYLFRETDGGPPLAPLTVELIDQTRAKYRETTGANGAFVFNKVKEGHYKIRARFRDFVIVDAAVKVSSGGTNFTAVMLPKRWAGAQTFRTVSAGQLTSQSNRDLQKKMRKAHKLVAKQNYAEAIKLYEEAVTTDAQPDLWDALGLLYLQMGKKDVAFQAFEKAIKLNPEYLLPYAHLGNIYLEEKRYKELLVLAQSALTIDSKWLTAHAFMGEAQTRTGDLGAAQRAAETASELARGRAPGPHLLLAEILYARKDCAGALRHMERFLELNTSVRELPETVKSLEILKGCAPVQ